MCKCVCFIFGLYTRKKKTIPASMIVQCTSVKGNHMEKKLTEMDILQQQKWKEKGWPTG